MLQYVKIEFEKWVAASGRGWGMRASFDNAAAQADLAVVKYGMLARGDSGVFGGYSDGEAGFADRFDLTGDQFGAVTELELKGAFLGRAGDPIEVGGGELVSGLPISVGFVGDVDDVFFDVFFDDVPGAAA